jgi:copper chaperone
LTFPRRNELRSRRTEGDFTKLHLPDMSDGHCKASIEEAIAALDPGARAVVELNAKTVEIATDLDSATIIASLAGRGFPVQPGHSAPE